MTERLTPRVVTQARVNAFVPGGLVTWPSAPGSPIGVVVEASHQTVRVRFDNDPEAKVFSAKAGVLGPVELTGTVRR